MSTEMEEEKRTEECISIDHIDLPLNIFSTELGTLETLVKYLKENFGHNFSAIAGILNRDPRTIWGAYKSALEKHPEPFFGIPETAIELPVQMLRDRHFGMLEHLVWHMHENLGMRYARIATLIKRNDRTVWTAWMRAKKKRFANGVL
jgi:hypothetical protein